MKIGKVNKILDNVENIFSSESGDIGSEITNILDNNTLKKWEASFSQATIQIELTQAITADIISLFNICITGTVELKTLDASDVVIDTFLFNESDAMGLQNTHLLAETTSSTPIKKLQLVISTSASDADFNQGVTYGAHGFFTVGYGVTGVVTSDAPCFLGYIWAGDITEFGCAENLQPFDNTGDRTTITRSNVPDTQEVYDYQTFNVTTNKDSPFLTLRDNFRFFMNDGLGEPRPFIFDEPYYTSPELVYGVFDATRIGYDVIYAPEGTTDRVAQATIGVREVF